MILKVFDFLKISFLLSLFSRWITICIASEEYVIADGIKISKLDFDNLKFENDRDFIDFKSEERALEYRLQIKEKSAERNKFPSKCHGKNIYCREQGNLCNFSETILF